MKPLYLGIIFFVVIGFHASASGHKNTFAEKDVFQQRFFISNANEIYSPYQGEPVRFFAECGSINIFFTDKGPVYRLLAPDTIDSYRDDHDHAQSEKENEQLHVKASFVSVTWLGANPHPSIDSAERNTGYYSYISNAGGKLHSVVTQGYRRITYRGLYPGIDVEYTLPEKGGMKYNLIVHPGADLSRVKMQYGRDVQRLYINSGGGLTAHTAAGDVTELAPISYTGGGSIVQTQFTVNGNIAGFNTPAGYDRSQTLIVDPWVGVLSQLTVRNLGTSSDFDLLGNLFVYGAGPGDLSDITNYHKVAKFNSAGVFQWVFMGSVPSQSWSSYSAGYGSFLSNAKVDKQSGKVYVGKGFDANGTQMIRLTSAGVYDNFITAANLNFQETWSIQSNCATGTILAIGGGTNSTLNMGVVDPLTGNVTTANITGQSGAGQDIAASAYDPYGNLYAIISSLGNAATNGHMYKVNSTFNGNIWDVVYGYTVLSELRNMPAYSLVGTGYNGNNFNAMAADSAYIYYCDGYNLAAYNIANGSHAGTACTIPGYTALGQGGIAVDNCRNLYVGGKGVIKTFSFNGSVFTPGTDIPLGGAFSGDTIFDVKYNPSNNLLYVTGGSIVGTYAASLSANCTISNTFTTTLISACNSANITVAPGPGLVSPVVSYIWQDSSGNIIRQAGPGTALHDTLPAPSPGLYTVQVQLNINCGGTAHTDTFRITCSNLLHSNDTSICVGRSATLWASGTPVGGTYAWAPGGANTATITVSPSSNTTYSVTYTPPGGTAETGTITVTVSPPITTPVSQTICNGGSYNFYGRTLTTAGTYRDTLNRISGCDSIIVLTLSVAASSTTPVSQSICSGSSYSFYGRTLTTTGTYYDTLQNVGGCDSIIVLTLNVTASSTTPVSQIICSGSSYGFYGRTLTAAGTYRDTLTGAAHCDSFIVLTLTVLPVTTTPVAQIICSGSSYGFYGRTLTAAGTYRDTLANINGCDSVIVLTLTVLPVTTTPVAKSICSGSSYNFHGRSLTAAGTYADTLAGMHGCDSIINLTLAVLPVYTTPISQSICSGLAYPFHGHNLTAAGIYNDTLSTVNGCDSIIVLTLTLLPLDTTRLAQTICSNGSYNFFGQNLNTANTYAHTLTNVNGCDSVIILTLTVLPVTTTPQTQTICNGSSYNFYGRNLTAAGNYRDTLTAVSGCDSIISLTLTTLNPTTTPQTQTICNGSSYNFYGRSLTAAGNYLDTLTNIYGCDSIISLTLTTLNPTTTPQAQTICSNKSYNFYGRNLTAAGNYLDTLSNIYGCDSIISLTLTVIPTSASVLSQTICSNGSFTFGNQTLTAAGTYVDTLTGPNGCDSVVTLVLNVLPVSASGAAASICQGDSFAFGGQQLHNAGTYLDTVTAANGCDSVIALTLTVVPMPEAAFVIEPKGNSVPLGVISVTDQSLNESSALWRLNNSLITPGTDGALPITDTGNYCIGLTALNSAGCGDTALQCISVYNENLYVPNAFTPNGDGKNDVFEVFGSRKGMKYMSISIFDRWGEKVFESDDLYFTWDGRYRGALEEPGVFVYVLNITYLDNRSIQNKGSITLIR